jgi:aryl-alcohol dehydrogenase-like predicted oxidoreductase
MVQRIGSLEVSDMGLGCMGLSSVYNQTTDARARDVVGQAFDLGISHFDTADVYGSGHNERLIGEALKGRGDSVVIATKFGLVQDKHGSYVGVDGRPERVRAACEASLRRLGTSQVDIYYLHRLDPSVPVEDTVGAMADLVAAGLVREIGLSEVSLATVEAACTVHHVAVVQSEYSLWSRGVERSLLPALRQRGIAFVAYSPLGRGGLAATLTSEQDLRDGDYRRGTPRFQGEHFRRNKRLAEALARVAEGQRITAAQAALAWVARQDGVIPIPGSTTADHLRENVQALALRLSEATLQSLDEIFVPDAASGERYPANRMAELDG